jgi:signal transduction histidine kinase
VVTLESCKVFDQLPPAERKALEGRAREIRFAAGRQIFTEGDPGDGVYVVRSGVVQISAVVGDGEPVVFSKVTAGDVFGEMSLLDGGPRSACATAEQDTDVFFVPRDAMVEVLRRSPELSMNLVQEVSGRLRVFNGQYLREVLRAERMTLVGRFAASIVHDLKNPLAVISFAAEMASQEHATAENRKMAQQRIGVQVERISSMVNDILEFTRGVPIPPTFAETDYGALVRSVVEELQKEVGLKSVHIEYDNSPPSVKVLANPQRLGRVFHNLISNAVDVMPEGGKIRLRFEVTDQQVVTEVADTGTGIAPEIADKLFEAFSTHGKAHGTGLGLFIVQRILQEHGGSISAHNQPGGGAVLRFTLPRTRKP